MMAKDICPRHKIYGNLSWMNCPVRFNQSAQTINCTLHTRSSSNLPTGTMKDIEDGYLRIYAFFGTKTSNISIPNFVVKSNGTGTFNVTLNVSDITTGLGMDIWRNITIYAESVYPIGPNQTTRNVSVLFKRVSFQNAARVGVVGRTVGIGVFCLIAIVLCHLCFR